MTDALEHGGAMAAVYRNIRKKGAQNQRISREEALAASAKISELKGKIRPMANAEVSPKKKK